MGPCRETLTLLLLGPAHRPHGLQLDQCKRGASASSPARCPEPLPPQQAVSTPAGAGGEAAWHCPASLAADSWQQRDSTASLGCWQGTWQHTASQATVERSWDSRGYGGEGLADVRHASADLSSSQWPDASVLSPPLARGHGDPQQADRGLGAGSEHRSLPLPSPTTPALPTLQCRMPAIPLQILYHGMKHSVPRSSRAAKRLCMPPSCSSFSHSPIPPFPNKMTQQHAAPWPCRSPCTLQSFKTPHWGSSRVPLSSAVGFLDGSWRGAGTLLSDVHCPGSGTPETG